MKSNLLLMSLISCVLSFPQTSWAHSGGLNAQGCHAGTQQYHCHRSPSEMVVRDGRPGLRCDLGSRAQACQSGMSGDVVRTYQLYLTVHCPELPSGFADGEYGPATLAAVMLFQATYGLTVDGVIGANTAAALLGPSNGQCRL